MEPEPLYIELASPFITCRGCDLSHTLWDMDAPVDTGALAAELRRAFEKLEDHIDEAHGVFCDVLLALEKLSSMSPAAKPVTT